VIRAEVLQIIVNDSINMKTWMAGVFDTHLNGG